MANIERTYNVPLRREFQKAPKYKRSKKAVNALKRFLQRHMKTEEVRIGKKLNEKIWMHGMKNPPHHVQVTVIKEDDGIAYAELTGFKYAKEEASKEAAEHAKHEHTHEKEAERIEHAAKEKKEEAAKKGAEKEKKLEKLEKKEGIAEKKKEHAPKQVGADSASKKKKEFVQKKHTQP